MHYLDYMTSWTYHVILSCDLEFLGSCDYVSRQLLVQDLSCSLYTCHTIYARSYCTWAVFSIIPVIIIIFSSRYCQTYCLMSYLLLLHFHILSFIVLFPSVLFASPLLTDLYIIFQYLDLKSWYRELFVDHILLSLFSGEFSFLLNLFIQI